MILTVYLIIISYFLLGVVAFYFINRKKEPSEARKSWLKTLVYFLIINIVCLSIVINPVVFRCLALLIILIGFYELFGLFRESGFSQKFLFLISILFFIVFSVGFIIFSRMSKEIIFFTYAVLSIFDSFSEITGKLWGSKKIIPSISPNKTVAGFAGGLVIAIISGLLFKGLIASPAGKVVFLSSGIALFAFIGDSAASFYKRKFGVKDFSNLIPAHGGFLDRFDSLIGGGAWVALLSLVANLI